MDKKELLKTIILDSQSRTIPKIWARSLAIPLDAGKIITLTGVRRSGKTYHLFDLMNQLKAKNIANERLLYINFEDERLRLESTEIDLVLQAYQELYPDLDMSTCYFFFDEVQEVEGWEKFVDRLYSTISQRVFITGSNSKLLSREIATALRGRTVTFEVYPLSFSEFVNVAKPGLNPHSSSDKARLIALFRQFMDEGSFPEIIAQTQDLKDKILQEYFNVMLLRDLVERYDISQVAVLKYFCKRVIGASACEFSVNKIYNDLKSQGYSVGRDTLYAYRDNVDAIYMGRFIAKYSESIVQSEGSQKKVYAIDSGLGSAIDFKFSEDEGRKLETVVALELLKQGKQLFYYQDNVECDFVVSDRGRIVEALQVAISISDDEARKREIKGLVQCCKRLDLREGLIVTLDTEETITSDGVTVYVVPAWKYFLQS
ncbi:MAG TPA: ATP-binding protein [Candidatus Saccharimonadales bacterium]